MQTTATTNADHEMDTAYQNEFTEEAMPSPADREKASHDLRMDPTTTPGNNASGTEPATGTPMAGGEPDFDDAVAAEDDEDDDDDEDEETV